MATDVSNIRKAMIEAGVPEENLKQVVRQDGPVWTTEQLREDFEVLGFQAPIVVVKRKSDGKVGSLEFNHRPRLYFNWVED